MTEADQHTIHSVLSMYQDYMVHEKRFGRGTVEAYLSDLRDLARHQPGDVSQINPAQLRAYLRFLSGRGLSERTIERKFAAFSTFWRWLRREGFVTGDPVSLVDLPRQSVPLPVWLSEQELMIFALTSVEKEPIEAAQRDTLAWRLLAWLGLRRSELLNLQIEDVWLDAGVVLIRKPKNKRDRALPLPAALKPNFEEVIAGRKSGYVFISSTGHQWAITQFMKAFRDHVKRCGLKDRKVTPHVIRHSVGTHMHERGVVLADVQQLLGHVDIKSTMIYVHISGARLRAALPIRIYPG